MGASLGLGISVQSAANTIISNSVNKTFTDNTSSCNQSSSTAQSNIFNGNEIFCTDDVNINLSNTANNNINFNCIQSSQASGQLYNSFQANLQNELQSFFTNNPTLLNLDASASYQFQNEVNTVVNSMDNENFINQVATCVLSNVNSQYNDMVNNGIKCGGNANINLSNILTTAVTSTCTQNLTASILESNQASISAGNTATTTSQNGMDTNSMIIAAVVCVVCVAILGYLYSRYSSGSGEESMKKSNNISKINYKVAYFFFYLFIILIAIGLIVYGNGGLVAATSSVSNGSISGTTLDFILALIAGAVASIFVVVYFICDLV